MSMMMLMCMSTPAYGRKSMVAVLKLTLKEALLGPQLSPELVIRRMHEGLLEQQYTVQCGKRCSPRTCVRGCGGHAGPYVVGCEVGTVMAASQAAGSWAQLSMQRERGGKAKCQRTLGQCGLSCSTHTDHVAPPPSIHRGRVPSRPCLLSLMQEWAMDNYILGYAARGKQSTNTRDRGQSMIPGDGDSLLVDGGAQASQASA